ncbi:hypothetical protein Tco_0345698 [Tanacetum coccineum]
MLEDLALYDNESWNDPRDFAKLVKAITLPQDVPSTSDRRLDWFPNSWHLRTLDLSGVEALFKQTAKRMTNKIDIVLKAITDRIAGTLPSDTVKNPKLGTHTVSSALSYPIIDPQCSSQPSTSINATKAHFNDAATEPQQPEEPEPTLEDEFLVRKLNSMLESLGLVPRSFNAKFIFSKDDDGEVMFIKIVRDNEPQCDDPHKVEGATTEEPVVEYFNTFPARNELTYHRNKEDNRREVQYVMSKILGFYKECLELGPEYLTGVDDEEEVMLYLMRRSLEVLRKFHRTILGG